MAPHLVSRRIAVRLGQPLHEFVGTDRVLLRTDRLEYQHRRPDPARLFVLGTYRPVDAIVQTHPLRTILTELRRQKFDGNIAIEYEYNWHNSVPDIAQCIGFVRGWAAANPM